MIFGDNQDVIEKIEQKLFVNFNQLPSFSRRYVNICNKSLRIWTVSLNTESKNTPVVLIHGFGGGSALWLQNFKELLILIRRADNRTIIFKSSLHSWFKD